MKMLCIVSITLSMIVLMSMKQERKKIIFFGDSITQQGVRPNGYVDRLKKAIPGFEVIGAGIGGNKVYDLYLRLEEDVLNKKPSTVVIYVGVNDVWH
ncbi:MAG: G-D-S-L family lipolytic protein, partial [Pedobacter sp.]